MTVPSGLAYSKVQSILAAYSITQYFNADVSSYSGTGLTLSVTGVSGSGISLQPWDVNLAGSVGQAGPQGSQGVQGITGATGVTGSTPTQYVVSVNGLTGILGLSAGTGISFATAGNTLTITSTAVSGVSTVNGLSGTVILPYVGIVQAKTGLTALNAIDLNGVQSIQLSNAGVLSLAATSPIQVSASTGSITISSNGTRRVDAGAGITVSNGGVGICSVTNTGVLSFNGQTGTVQGVSTFNGQTGTVQGVSTFNGQTGTVQGVSTFNGQTGTVQGVSTVNGSTGTVYAVSLINGLSGTVGLSGGTNITITPSGNTLIISSVPLTGITGVLSYNGQTGNVQGVCGAVAGSGISVSGITGSVTISNTGVTGISAGAFISISGTTGNVVITNTGIRSISQGSGIIVNTSNPNDTQIGNSGVLSVGGFTGYVGLSGSSSVTITQSGNTFVFTSSGSGISTGVANTFTQLQSFTRGISSFGATFSSDITVNNARIGMIKSGAPVDENNIVFGYQSLTSVIPSVSFGRSNVAIGNRSLTNITTGIYNTTIGSWVMPDATTADGTVAIGTQSLFNLVTGTSNIAIGNAPLFFLTSGSNVIGIGAGAGQQTSVGGFLTGATNSIFLGNSTRSLGTTSQQEIVIGSGATGNGSFTTVIGNRNTTSTTIYGQLILPSGLSGSIPNSVSTINGLSGNIILAEGSGISIVPSGNTLTITSTATSSASGVSSFNGQTGDVQGVSTFNGQTGTVQGVSTFNGQTGTVQGVSTIRGLTGTIGLSAGTGISLSVSGNTITIISTVSGSCGSGGGSTYIPDLRPLGNTADIITMRSGGWTVAPINTIATPLLIKGGTALPGSMYNIKLQGDGSSTQSVNLGNGTWFYTYMIQRPGVIFSTSADPAVIIDQVTNIVSSNSNIIISQGLNTEDILGYAIKLSGNTSGIVSGGGLGPA